MADTHENWHPNYTLITSFKQRVEALAGITISTDPTEAEASVYIRQAVSEISQRIISLRPQDAPSFSKAYITENNSTIAKESIGKITSVLREDGTSGGWRNCRYVTPDLIGRVVDTNSIHFASKYNPCYTVGNKYVEVYPVPSNDNESVRIYNVNITPESTNGEQLDILSRDIAFFPVDKEYLVTLYVAIKCLDKLVSAAHANMPSNLSISSSVPALPPLSDNSFTFTETAPTYVAPTLSLASKPNISDLSISVTAPEVPGVIINSISLGEAPNYVAPVLSSNFTDADTWINTEEDPEMSRARVEVESAKIQKYSSDIQNASSKFQEELIEYQQEFQKSTTNSQLDGKKGELEISKYSM